MSENVNEIGVNGVVVTMPWGDEILSFRYEGKIYVKVADITTALGVSHEPQLDKLRAHPALSEELIKRTPVALGITEGIRASHMERGFWAITLRGMYAWLCGISVARVREKGNEEAADKLLDYQRECMDILENYWTYGIATNPRMVVGKALNTLHIENRLNLSCEGLENLKDNVYTFYDVLNHFGILNELKNSDPAVLDFQASTRGSTLLVDLIRDAIPPATPVTALHRANCLTFLSMLAQVDNSDLLLNVYGKRFLAYPVNDLFHYTDSIGDMDVDMSRPVILEMLWKTVYKFTSEFCYEVFQDEIIENIELKEFISMTMNQQLRKDGRKAQGIR